ncbi:MAG: glycosyltransferase family 4 protein [Propionibacteriaceae bacterium]|nr:glycosyltransferase family 4 protein [Propionibacteriaceae bacterium]
MRVLYVIDSLAPGGAETSLAAMAPGLAHQGIELHVLPSGENLDLAPQLRDAGACVHNRVHAPGRLGNVREVVHRARAVTPDLIHTTLFEADIAGRVAARLAALPSSTSIVGETYGDAQRTVRNPHKLRAALTIDRATARLARRFHSVSSDLARQTAEKLRIPLGIIDVIPRGRASEGLAYRPEGVRGKVRRDFGIGDRTSVILTVGRLDAAKGLEYLIQALPAVHNNFPRVVVLMAGKDGAASERIRSAAAASPVDIRLLGHRHDIPDLMAAADLLCFPSLSEGSPGTLIEAMAVGCPIVASSIRANLEVLGHGPDVVGAVFPPGDPETLASALLEALHHRDTPRTTRARQRFEDQFQIDSIAERMAKFFDRAAN